jgi:hypothetical protein
VYRTHPCLAHIIDHEDGLWLPTRVGLGGSYGLPMASPRSKLAYYTYTADGHRRGQPVGPGWATNPWDQLSWAENYADGRYGSECAAWAFWQQHHWY